MARRTEVRILSEEGRVKILPEYLRLHNLAGGDKVEISCNSSSINVKKYREENICAVTGKFSTNGDYYGNVYISKEGIQHILSNTKKSDPSQ